MSTLLLSLLLIFLVGLMLLMHKGSRENFAMPKPNHYHEEKEADDESECPKPNCPKHECPDMSQYVKLDEVPCWNCSLP